MFNYGLYLVVCFNCAVPICLWRGPLQDEKHWRRPVPGWRQTPESLSLENRGFGFEEAEFEVHFSEKGTDYFKL